MYLNFDLELALNISYFLWNMFAVSRCAVSRCAVSRCAVCAVSRCAVCAVSRCAVCAVSRCAVCSEQVCSVCSEQVCSVCSEQVCSVCSEQVCSVCSEQVCSVCSEQVCSVCSEQVCSVCSGAAYTARILSWFGGGVQGKESSLQYTRDTVKVAVSTRTQERDNFYHRAKVTPRACTCHCQYRRHIKNDIEEQKIISW